MRPGRQSPSGRAFSCSQRAPFTSGGRFGAADRFTHVNVSAPNLLYWTSRHQSGVVHMENDRTYFMRRAAQERSAAANASAAKARRAHLDLAKRYRGLVQRKARATAETNA
jgi:hypothetical protein